MTTDTTNSQAASIDTPEFWVLLNAREEGAMDEAHAEELEQDIVKFIDAKLAQAREEGRREGLKQQLMLNGQFGCTHNCNQGRDCTCDTSGLPR